jgi:hypothetical protein
MSSPGSLLQSGLADAEAVAQDVQRRIEVRIAFIANLSLILPPQRRKTRQRLSAVSVTSGTDTPSRRRLA